MRVNVKYRKDILLIAIVLAASVALWLVSQLSASTDVTAVVAYVDGREVLRRPLVMNAVYEIPNADGHVNVICVENGEVFMQEANCRDGLCIRQGRMKNTAKTIVCLPNKVVIKLEGDSGVSAPADDIDVIIQ